MLLTILLVLLIVALLGGFPLYQSHGPIGFSPLGIIILVLLILWLAGYLR